MHKNLTQNGEPGDVAGERRRRRKRNLSLRIYRHTISTGVPTRTGEVWLCPGGVEFTDRLRLQVLGYKAFLTGVGGDCQVERVVVGQHRVGQSGRWTTVHLCSGEEITGGLSHVIVAFVLISAFHNSGGDGATNSSNRISNGN